MSLSDETVVRLAASEIVNASELLTRSFWGDAFTTFMFPVDAIRRDLLPKFFLLNIQHALIRGEIYTTETLKGVAVWYFPGDGNRPALEKTRITRMLVPETIGEGPFQRLSVVTRYTNEMHRSLLEGRHCYLMFLGIEPAQQQKGVGSKLIAPVQQMADKQGLLCYLETMKKENLAFYAKNGFRVASEIQVPEGGPYVWALIRQPTK